MQVQDARFLFELGRCDSVAFQVEALPLLPLCPLLIDPGGVEGKTEIFLVEELNHPLAILACKGKRLPPLSQIMVGLGERILSFRVKIRGRFGKERAGDRRGGKKIGAERVGRSKKK